MPLKQRPFGSIVHPASDVNGVLDEEGQSSPLGSSPHPASEAPLDEVGQRRPFGSIVHPSFAIHRSTESQNRRTGPDVEWEARPRLRAGPRRSAAVREGDERTVTRRATRRAFEIGKRVMTSLLERGLSGSPYGHPGASSRKIVSEVGVEEYTHTVIWHDDFSKGARKMATQETSKDLQIAISFLRLLRGWTQAKMAEAAGVDKSLISLYEQGKRVPSPRTLDKLVDAVGLSTLSLDWVLSFIRSARAAVGGSDEITASLAQFIARSASVVIQLAIVEAMEEIGGEPGQQPRGLTPEEARARAEALWEDNQDLASDDWRALIEDSSEYQSWAVCERLCTESSKASEQERCLELAELGVAVAEKVLGDEVFRSRLQGYAWACLAEARRGRDDLDGMDRALARSREHWKAASPDESDAVDPKWILEIAEGSAR